MVTTTAFTEGEYFDILERSEIKLEYHAGEIRTMWGERIESRGDEAVTVSGFSLSFQTNEIAAMAGVKPDYSLVAANAVAVFGACLKKMNCIGYAGQLLVYIEPFDLYTFPDISFVCGKPIYKENEGGLDALANPTHVVEILSDNSEAYDRGDKFDYYRALESLQEYILVSVKKRKIEVFARNTPHEWIQRIYDDENPLVKIGGCEIELSEIYRMVTFDIAS